MMWPSQWSQETWAIALVGVGISWALETIRRLYDERTSQTVMVLEDLKAILQQAPWYKDPLDESFLESMERWRREAHDAKGDAEA